MSDFKQFCVCWPDMEPGSASVDGVCQYCGLPDGTLADYRTELEETRAERDWLLNAVSQAVQYMGNIDIADIPPEYAVLYNEYKRLESAMDDVGSHRVLLRLKAMGAR